MKRTEIIEHLKKNKSLLKLSVGDYIKLVDAFFEKSEYRGMECPLLDVPEEELIEHLEHLYFMNLTAQIMMREGVELFCQCGIVALDFAKYPHIDHLLDLIQFWDMDDKAKGDYSREQISMSKHQATKWSKDSVGLLYRLLKAL